MKLNKKILCAVLAAAMSLSSVAALADVPVAKDNVQAFVYAENYFNQGLYYEAREVLNQMPVANPNGSVIPFYSHEQERLNLWKQKVNEKIEDWEITEIFNKVQAKYNEGDIPAANAALIALDAYRLDVAECAKKDAWKDLLSKIRTEREAIVTVERYYVYDILWDPNLYYSVVKVNGGWDVYVKSVNSAGNVAAYHVDENTFVVTPDDADYNGNPAAEYQWR